MTTRYQTPKSSVGNYAGQITSRTAANTLYAWTDSYSVNRGYAVNGLNQYTASGSVTPTYDEKGNLASAGGSASYTHSTKNELVTRVDMGIGFYHDPLGRLDEVVNGGYGFQCDRLTSSSTCLHESSCKSPRGANLDWGRCHPTTGADGMDALGRVGDGNASASTPQSLSIWSRL